MPNATASFRGRALGYVTRLSRRVRRDVYVRALRIGDRYACPICGWSGLRFLPGSKPSIPNRICPNCNSTERYRALELWLRRGGAVNDAALLEIAPIELVRGSATELGYCYASLDLSSSRAMVLGDLCRTPFRDESFDTIICFHVLEHIPNDSAAMSELGRILKPKGSAIVIVPWDTTTATTFEGASDDPADNERLYGQSDHVRIYGRDVTDRLRDAGLEVEEVRWADAFEPDQLRHHLLPGDDDRFWICRPT